MKLAKIKLSGFKSFVDNTTIDLTGSLVGIVGPNGCGKSNVIDAIRWVLGESSAKQLRGGAMQDVIFNGSEKRTKVSRASVELIFDNSQEPKIITNSLYASYSEISVKRVITRQGDSEYLINNQNVRRRDIIELFLGTGVGSRGYAIIEQGMISRIIESRPDELRVYLEEASGVSKYREKRRETLSKLDSTRDNLMRINDLQHELAISIEKLTLQASKAREYQELNNRLNELNILSGLLKKENNLKQYKALEHEINTYHNELELVSQNKNTVYEELQINYEQKDVLDEECGVLNLKFNELRASIARYEERESNSIKRQASLRAEIEQNILDIERLNQEITVQEEELINNQQHKLYLEQEIAKVVNVTSENTRFNELANEQQSAMIQVKSLESQLVELKHNKNLLLNTHTHKKQQLNNLITRQNKLSQETTVNILDLDIRYNELSEELDKQKQSLTMLKNDYANHVEQLDTLRVTETGLMQQISQINSDISGLKSSKLMLEQFVDTSKPEHKADGANKLVEVLVVEDKYLNAVNAVLDICLSATLVMDTAQFGVTSQAIINTVDDTIIRQDSLAHMVSLKDKRFGRVYNILNEYMLVDDLECLINTLPDKLNAKYVTLNGDVFFNGVFIANESRELPNLLYYQTELNRVENEILYKNTHLDSLSTKQTTLNLQIASLVEVVATKLEELERLNEGLNQLTLEQIKLEQNHNFIKQHQEKTTQELETISFDITFLEEELLELSIKLDDLDTSIATMTQSLTTATEQLESINRLYTQLVVKDKERRDGVDKMQTEVLLLEQKSLLIHNLKDDKQKQILGLINKNTNLEYEINELSYQIESIDLVSLKDEILGLTILLEEKNLALKNILTKIDGLKNKQGTIDSHRDELKEKINIKNLKLQEYKIAIDNINELLAELSIAESEIDSLLTSNKLSISEVQSSISNYKKQIEELGLVNLAAIQDLEEATTKYTEIANQILDLEEAIMTLETAIGQIDKTTSKMLYDTYNQVNIIFNDYFRLLFGGGGARLELTDSDILTAGVQIFAEPLGKRNSSIHLLSGGEKALTAVSLVFAFFSLSPSPFCILDEVDAPLDDANTLRFCKLVKQLALQTQFIYISHNRLAMEMANQLVGVTMQEKGVSTIVSVTLDSE